MRLLYIINSFGEKNFVHLLTMLRDARHMCQSGLYVQLYIQTAVTYSTEQVLPPEYGPLCRLLPFWGDAGARKCSCGGTACPVPLVV